MISYVILHNLLVQKMLRGFEEIKRKFTFCQSRNALFTVFIKDPNTRSLLSLRAISKNCFYFVGETKKPTCKEFRSVGFY